MVVLGIVLFLLSFSAHELGHAFAMRRYGIKISEISLLGFGPTIFTFRLRRWFGDVPVRIKLIPLGAFVRPEDKDCEANLSFKQKVHVNGGGVIANVLFFGIILLPALLLDNVSLLPSCIISGIAITIGLFPRFTTHLILPIGILLLGLLIFSVSHSDPKNVVPHPKSLVDVHKNLVGNGGSIVAIAQEVNEKSKNLAVTILFAALLSLGVGLTQALPIYPLDGGRIAYDVIEVLASKRKLPGEIFKKVSLCLFVYLIIISLGGDIARLMKIIF
jgi:membrane-associated protease RseP (regulator of RpoE activity)